MRISPQFIKKWKRLDGLLDACFTTLVLLLVAIGIMAMASGEANKLNTLEYHGLYILCKVFIYLILSAAIIGAVQRIRQHYLKFREDIGMIH